MRPRIAGSRPLAWLVALLVAAAPLSGALHEAGHFVHAAPLAYSAHDDDAHHEHHPVDSHGGCALCTHAKSHHALAVSAPCAAHVQPSAQISLPAAARGFAPAHAALPAPRAPPIAS